MVGPGDVESLPEGLSDALECEAEGAWVERRQATGDLPETLHDALRAAALAAFDASAAEDLLADALVADETTLEQLAPDVHAQALAAFDAAPLDELSCEELLPDVLVIEDVCEAPDVAITAARRAAALAAWDATPEEAAQPAPVLTLHEQPPSGQEVMAARPGRPERSEPLRARRMRAPLFMRPLAAAAMLLLVLGAGIFLLGGSEDAEAGLQLRSLARRDLDSGIGMSRIEPLYFASLGHLFVPEESELLSFGLARDGMVVVGAGDAVRVTRPRTQVAGVAGSDDAVLRLESGEARLATRDAPIPLEVDGVGLLVLEEGAAHVLLHAETASGAPAVALAEHSVARFHRADGTSVPLSGPTRVVLTADGVQSFGTPARSLFRELAFFGGPLPEPTQVSPVSARVFEIKTGPARRGRQDVRILAAEPGKASTVTLTWRPSPAVFDARSMRVALRAPSGTTVALAQEGQASLSAELQRAGDGSEPGVATVELSLPEGWFDRLPDGRLELTLVIPAQPARTPEADKTTAHREAVRAWFDGISLVLGPSEDGLPIKAWVASSPAMKSVPGAPEKR